MSRRVLLVDNDRDFLETRTELLQQEGYLVYPAVSLEAARQRLAETWVHVAVVDIRLRDDNDDKDKSGLTFAKESLYRAVPKIMLTRYPSYEQVREVMGPELAGLPPAVDFIAKQGGIAALRTALDETFAKFVRIDEALVIRWQMAANFVTLAGIIDPAQPAAELWESAVELEDLFRRLFYACQQITLSQQLLVGEHYVVLAVSAYGADQSERQVIVSCGRVAAIEEKYRRYEQFAAPNEGRGSTVLDAKAHTLNFAALAYRLVGGRSEEIKRFEEFYRANNAAEVEVALDHLYNNTLRAWHDRRQYYVPSATLSHDYASLLGVQVSALMPAELQPRIEAICQQAASGGLAALDYSPHHLTVRLAPERVQTLVNPAHCLTMQLDIGPSLYGAIHGGVRPESVLVNPPGETWLVDFARAGAGPLLFDFVLLETTLMRDLLDVGLPLRYELEERLLGAAHLEPEVENPVSPVLEKPLAAIHTLRRLAGELAGPAPAPYLLGLFLCSIEPVARFDPAVRYLRSELIQTVHSLLASALLCQQLTHLRDARLALPTPALDGIWINEENRQVWAHGRQVELSSQEFSILHYLSSRAGKLCTRRAIFEEALEQHYEDDMVERTRVDSAMSRLRRKIELDPDNPQHLHTARGQGYRFEW
ncbi:MAG TPA: DNA-binding response regulator [Caldilineaceae bacterium]|nr:DNA-binding response regulator [Caldilineaceae bacterium]